MKLGSLFCAIGTSFRPDVLEVLEEETLRDEGGFFFRVG
jgi:hypothetical protein